MLSKLSDEGEGSVRFPAFHHRKDGSHYPVEVELTASRLNGEPVYIATALDITGRALTEERLRKTLEDLARLNRYEAVINTVTQAVYKSIDVRSVLENSVDALSRNMDAVKNICIYLVEGDEAVMQAHRGYPEWFVERVKVLSRPKGFTWRTIIEGRMCYVPDTDSDTVMGQAGRELGTKSYLSMPLMAGGSTVGVININSEYRYAFGAEELRVLDIVSRQIEIAIGNARYAETLLESERALAEKVKLLSKKEQYEKIINLVTRSVHSSFDLKDVMENAVRVMGETITNVDMVQLHMVEGTDAVLQARWGHPEWFAVRVGRIPYPKGLTWQTIIEGVTRSVPDTDCDTAIGPAGREAGIKSYVAMPIRPGGETIGCIGINSYSKNVFFEDELTLLDIMKTQLETAILKAMHVEELRLSEQRYQALAEVSPIGIFQSDREGNGVYVNNKLCEITGLSKTEAYSEGWKGRLHPDDRDYVVSNWVKAVSTGGEYIDEYRFVKPSGDVVWVTAQALPVRGTVGEVTGFVGTLTDITERKLSEGKIRYQASLLDQVRNSVIATDLEGRIIYWNRFAEELYQWKADEVAGRSIMEVTQPEEADWKTESIAEALKESGHWEGELLSRRKDGTTFPAYVISSEIRDERGKLIGYVGVGTDITEKKTFEARLLRTQRLESIGTLAGGIAHDLNNILQPILMSIALLRAGGGGEKTGKTLEVLDASARRGADLVKQVLSFARGVETEKQTVDVGYLIADVLSIARETFPKSIEIYSFIGEDTWSVPGDYTQLHQVLLNMCVNARDAMPDGGKISVTAANTWVEPGAPAWLSDMELGRYVSIAISDNGCGIGNDIIDKIFDPFFTTKGPDKGTGLGLSTAYGIVKEHGGYIHVESEAGVGSIFVVYLPPLTPDARKEPVRGEADAMPRGSGETVLVVDDEQAVLEVTTAILDEFGYNVLSAKSGPEAIDIACAIKIDAAVVDMMMPVMGGAEVVRILKGIFPSLRVISVSGYQKESEVIKVEENLLDAFLPKPFNAETLLKTLDNVLHK